MNINDHMFCLQTGRNPSTNLLGGRPESLKEMSQNLPFSFFFLLVLFTFLFLLLCVCVKFCVGSSIDCLRADVCVSRAYWERGMGREWRYWGLKKEHMGGVDTNHTNRIGIPVTKQCLNKMAGQFSSLMEMSSNSSPSGNNATNNYRKLTLYLNSQMRGKSSRHLISHMNTKILLGNELEQCIGKLCSLKQHITLAKGGGTQVEWPRWMEFIRGDLLKMDFTFSKACEVTDWGWRRVGC